jgi:hypothetical protein
MYRVKMEIKNLFNQSINQPFSPLATSIKCFSFGLTKAENKYPFQHYKVRTDQASKEFKMGL